MVSPLLSVTATTPSVNPEGSPVLGAAYGAITAFGLALAFTMARKYRDLEVVPAAAVGALISGIIGFAFSTEGSIFNAPIWTIFTMGVLILPVSFAFLITAPRLYNICYCKFNYAVRNGNWTILGLVWYW